MRSGKAECGLQYAVRRAGNSVAYCSLSIRCGTRDEQGYHSGIAHFVEHTIFKGTEKKSSVVINSYLDKLGGELNAYTTKEEIVFHATVLKEDLAKASSLLFELATSPVFPEKEVEKEKGVVIDEINSYKDTPSEDIYDKFEEMLFSGHPLSSPILGTASSVKKITRNELLSFVGEKFIPENMAFTVVADLPEDIMALKAIKLIDRFCGLKPSVDSKLTLARQLSVPPANCFDKVLNKRNHQVNCVIGNYAPSLYDEKERVAAVLLCNIIGGPASNSILNSVLRERYGLVYGVECSYTQYSDTGVAVITLGCDKCNLEKCLDTIDREIGKLQTMPISQARLKAAKKQLLGQIAISSDNGEAQCLSMGKGLLSYGRVASDEETKDKLESVSSEDIMFAANKIFSTETRSRLIFV